MVYPSRKKNERLNHNPWCACAECRPRAANSASPYRLASSVSDAAENSSRGIDTGAICEFIERQIFLMSRELRKVVKMCPSASAAAAAKKVDAKPLLRGEHVPKKQWSGFEINIEYVREAPGDWTGIFILDIKPIFKDENGEPLTSWAVNKTNTALLAGKFGDDTDKWIGKKCKLFVVMVNNPKSKKAVPSLQVQE